MDSDNLLGQFRESWKQELQSKTDSKSKGVQQNCDRPNHKLLADRTEILQDPQQCQNTEAQTIANRIENTQGINADCESSLVYTNSLCYVSSNRLEISVNDLMGSASASLENKSDKRKFKKKNLDGNKKNKISRLDDIFCEKERGVLPQERLLDRLIQDIDEITAVPFFDISIPKEVAVSIFQYLDIKDLCSCAQVSKSWKVLSEDELIWCRICHRLGRETIYTTREKQNWKMIVQHNIERQRMLVANWKERTGKLSQLEHVRGKILCSLHSYKETVVAGYTNGEIKFWDLASGDSCIFQPSNTSLTVVEDYDVGTEQNIVQSVVTSDNITAALYSQGNVDIWNLSTGAHALQTYSPSPKQCSVTGLCLSKNSNTIVTANGHFLDVLYRGTSDEEFNLQAHMDTESRICDIKLLEIEREIPPIVLSKMYTINIFCPNQPEDTSTVPNDFIGQSGHMTEIHNIIDVPVFMFDIKSHPALLAVALGSYMFGTGGDWFKVQIYDLQTGKIVQSLQPHSAGEGPSTTTSCLNLADSPPNEMVTASADKKLRLYDLRQSAPTQTLEGHPQRISSVQMDEWKVVSGGVDGYLYGSVVYLWDRRMGKKLWDLHNRHPVGYCHFRDKHLIVGNIPAEKFPKDDEFEVASHRKYRGSIHVYDFLEDLTTQDVPEICLSTYDQPGASKYNIGLAMPYDTLKF